MNLRDGETGFIPRTLVVIGRPLHIYSDSGDVMYLVLDSTFVGPILWKSLPEVIIESPSIGSFKLSVKKFIICDKY